MKKWTLLAAVLAIGGISWKVVAYVSTPVHIEWRSSKIYVDNIGWVRSWEAHHCNVAASYRYGTWSTGKVIGYAKDPDQCIEEFFASPPIPPEPARRGL